MARYQIMYWREIPAQVKATDENETVRRMLADRFQQAIDGAAMARGAAGTDDYLNGWQWGPEEERTGSAQEVAETLAAELEEAYPKSRLAQIVRSRSDAG